MSAVISPDNWTKDNTRAKTLLGKGLTRHGSITITTSHMDVTGDGESNISTDNICFDSLSKIPGKKVSHCSPDLSFRTNFRNLKHLANGSHSHIFKGSFTGNEQTQVHLCLYFFILFYFIKPSVFSCNRHRDPTRPQLLPKHQLLSGGLSYECAQKQRLPP